MRKISLDEQPPNSQILIEKLEQFHFSSFLKKMAFNKSNILTELLNTLHKKSKSIHFPVFEIPKPDQKLTCSVCECIINFNNKISIFFCKSCSNIYCGSCNSNISICLKCDTLENLEKEKGKKMKNSLLKLDKLILDNKIELFNNKRSFRKLECELEVKKEILFGSETNTEIKRIRTSIDILEETLSSKIKENNSIKRLKEAREKLINSKKSYLIDLKKRYNDLLLKNDKRTDSLETQKRWLECLRMQASDKNVIPSFNLVTNFTKGNRKERR